MKKFLILSLLALSACSTLEGMTSSSSEEAAEKRRAANAKEVVDKTIVAGQACTAVLGVNDKEHGKIYYTKKHNLHKYVKLNKAQGDRGFCNEKDAKKAGFDEAPEYFSGSVYYLIQCLKSEGSGGKCHDYVAGIYKSLEIYGQVCGPRRSKTELADAVEDYATKNKDGMNFSKYEGTTSALLKKYRCR